jgi:hypothetical protein
MGSGVHPKKYDGCTAKSLRWQVSYDELEAGVRVHRVRVHMRVLASCIGELNCAPIYPLAVSQTCYTSQRRGRRVL